MMVLIRSIKTVIFGLKGNNTIAILKIMIYPYNYISIVGTI